MTGLGAFTLLLGRALGAAAAPAHLARSVIGAPACRFADNSTTFWWVSSGICLLLGSSHLVGVVLRWPLL
jgi:hypothetical protein